MYTKMGMVVYLGVTDWWIFIVKRGICGVKLKRDWCFTSLKQCHRMLSKLLWRFPYAKKYVVIDDDFVWMKTANQTTHLSRRKLIAAYKVWPDFKDESWCFDVKSIGQKSYLVSAIKDSTMQSIKGPLNGLDLQYVGTLGHCQWLCLKRFLKHAQRNVLFLQCINHKLSARVILADFGMFRSQVAIEGSLQHALEKLLAILQLQCPIPWESCVVMNDPSLLEASKHFDLPLQCFDFEESNPGLALQSYMKLQVLISCVHSYWWYGNHRLSCV